MNGFFSHLVSKQTNPAANISPRLKGRFESFSGFQPSSIKEVAEEKESVAPSVSKAILPHRNDNANIPEERFSQQPDKPLVNQQGNDAAIEGSIIAPPVSSKINNDQTDNTAWSATDNHQPLSADGDLLPADTKTFKNLINKLDQADTSLLNHFESDSEVKKQNDKQDLFSLQQNIQLTPQLEINMAVINAFKQLYKSEAKDDNPATQPSSTIKVNIGRIDVRAVTQQTTSKEMPRPKAGMSLDDFLKKKNGTN